MEFNDTQNKAIEIYLKSKDKLLLDPNYQLSSEEIKARFIVQNDPEIQKFLNDEIIKNNESIYETRIIKSMKLTNNKPVGNSQYGYANVILMSIIVIVLVAVVCVLIFL